MKKTTIQQEILLVTIPGFFPATTLIKNDDASEQHSALKEQIENACRDGLLNNLFYGISKKSTSGEKSFLWYNHHGNTFLQIDTHRFPSTSKSHFRLTPIFFCLLSGLIKPYMRIFIESSHRTTVISVFYLPCLHR